MNLGPILIGLPGTGLDDPGRKLLCHPAVGGVVLFARNFSNRGQLEQLVTDIHSARSPRPLVCIDQEGGRVQRLRMVLHSCRHSVSLAACIDADPVKALDMAYRHGRVMATEMLACGIDLSFAPVLDIDCGSSVIGDRALSSSPETVTTLGRAYLAGMHDAGMKTTGKHFPGHGSVVADSHVDDVTDPRSLKDIEQSDLAAVQGTGGGTRCLDDRACRLPPGRQCTRGLFPDLAPGLPQMGNARHGHYQGVVIPFQMTWECTPISQIDRELAAWELHGRMRKNPELIKCLDGLDCDLVLLFAAPEDVEPETPCTRLAGI